MSENEFWNNIDLKMPLPEEIKRRERLVLIEKGAVRVNGAKVFLREGMPQDGWTRNVVTVLLLHGKMFSSKTWLELRTLHILAAAGFHTIAIDLPGFGNTEKIEIPDKAVFLQHVIQALDLKHPVIISPSMSGFYTLPYLLKSWENIAGFIPVAPVGIEILEELPACKNFVPPKQVHPSLLEFLHDPIPDLSHIQTPTMVVFGEKDPSRSSALLSLLPASQCQEIPNGSHPAYLDDSDLWHQSLYNFMMAVEKTYH